MSLPAAAEAGFERWLRALERRHLANLRFSEITPALRALSSTYIERRETLTARGAFDSAGKRAAYALFYGPLHFLTVSAVIQRLGLSGTTLTHLVDWGCGTGAAGAAWARTFPSPPRISAIDTSAWAVTEARGTYAAFGLDADVRRGSVSHARIPASANALVAGWMLNEVGDDRVRKQLLARMLAAASRGTRVLIVEPIATRVSPWWPEWKKSFVDAGGRADEWRFRTELPDLVRRLDRAAGMRHEELTARSLWLATERHGNAKPQKTQKTLK